MREQPDPALAALIRRRREERNTTQEQLAFDAGITSSSLSRIERGRSNPSWTTVKRLAAALGLSLGELVADLERDSSASADSRSRAVPASVPARSLPVRLRETSAGSH